MPRLYIGNQAAYDNAIKSGAFDTATDVTLTRLPLLKTIPALPMATRVTLVNLPLLKTIAAMPEVTIVWLVNLPLLESIPAMPKLTGNHMRHYSDTTRRGVDIFEQKNGLYRLCILRNHGIKHDVVRTAYTFEDIAYDELEAIETAWIGAGKIEIGNTVPAR